ncbi:hypothetical protein ACVPOW_08395 [Staphylococcus aureus]
MPKEEGTIQLTLEVALQLGDDVVRTIAMDSTMVLKEAWMKQYRQRN